MTRDTFDNFINDLVSAFNARRPTPAVLREYYGVVQQIPEAKKDEFFSHCLREFNFFPKIKELADFVKCHYPIKTEHRYEVQIDDDYVCPYCLNIGLIRGEWKGSLPFPDQIYSADLPCPKCERGKRWHGKSTPFFDSFFGAEYLEKIRQTKQADYKRMIAWKNDKTQKEKDVSSAKTKIRLILRNWDTSSAFAEEQKIDVEAGRRRILEELMKA